MAEPIIEIENVHKRFGRVHALINAAGGNVPGATTNPSQRFFDLPEDALKQVVDLNLIGTIVPCQVFGRIMAEQGEGSIVNIASMAGLRPLTRTIAYSAAKAGVSNFTQWLAVHMAQEYSPRIRVNAIAPGFFHTRQNHHAAVWRSRRPARRLVLALVSRRGLRHRHGGGRGRRVFCVQRRMKIMV